MPTNASRVQDPYFSSSATKSTKSRPPINPSSARGFLSQERKHTQQRAAASVTKDRITDSRKVTTKQWTCDVCQRVFDDFNDATRHESACQLKRRLERLDRSSRRASSMTPTPTHNIKVPVHVPRPTKSSPEVSISSTTDAFEGETESKKSFFNVPRVIEFQKPTSGLLQNPSLDYQDDSIKYKESFATLSTTHVQQGFNTPFCSTTFSGIPDLPKTQMRKKELQQTYPTPSYLQSPGQHRSSAYERPAQTYLPPSYKQDEVRDIYHDNSFSNHRPTTYQSPSSPDITLNKIDSRDESSSRFHTRIPSVRDVRVIAAGRDESSSGISSSEREERHDSFDEQRDAYDDHMVTPKSMKWVCDVCKDAQFENYVEAFRHEMKCRKKFYLEQRQEQHLRDMETLAKSEPDRFYADQRAQRRENLKRQWYEKSRGLVSQIDSIQGDYSAPLEVPVPKQGDMGVETQSRNADGTKKWLCSICKQQYFEHYLDACRHEKECVMQMQPPQVQHQLKKLPRPTLRDRREKYS